MRIGIISVAYSSVPCGSYSLPYTLSLIPLKEARGRDNHTLPQGQVPCINSSIDRNEWEPRRLRQSGQGSESPGIPDAPAAWLHVALHGGDPVQKSSSLLSPGRVHQW